MTELTQSERTVSPEIRSPAMLHIGTRYGTEALVLGRNPLSEEVSLPSDLPPKYIVVKIADCTRADTSRIQLRIQKDEEGFFLQNLSSSVGMRLNKGEVSLRVNPGEKKLLGRKATDLQRFQILWGRPEIRHTLSVEGVGDSSEGGWYLGLKYQTTVRVK